MSVRLLKSDEDQLINVVSGLLQSPDNWHRSSKNVLSLKSILLATSGSNFDDKLADAYKLPDGFCIWIPDKILWPRILKPDITLGWVNKYRLWRDVRALCERIDNAQATKEAQQLLWSLQRAQKRSDEGVEEPEVPAQTPVLAGKASVRQQLQLNNPREETIRALQQEIINRMRDGL